jgi:hypothetical protein
MEQGMDRNRAKDEVCPGETARAAVPVPGKNRFRPGPFGKKGPGPTRLGSHNSPFNQRVGDYKPDSVYNPLLWPR